MTQLQMLEAGLKIAKSLLIAYQKTDNPEAEKLAKEIEETEAKIEALKKQK